MRILLTGKSGQLGWELHRQLERDFEVIALGREDIDFLDTRYVVSALRCLPRVDLIVNAAALTNADRAEREKFVAEAVNSEAAAALAAEADRRKIPMIHFSTNHVFGGRRQIRLLREEEQPSPISQYGITKLDGEVRLKKHAGKAFDLPAFGVVRHPRLELFYDVIASAPKGCGAKSLEGSDHFAELDSLGCRGGC